MVINWDTFILELLKPLGQVMMAGALIYGGILLGKAIMIVDLAKSAIHEADAKTKLAETKLKEMEKSDIATAKDNIDRKRLWEVTTKYGIPTDEENKDAQ